MGDQSPSASASASPTASGSPAASASPSASASASPSASASASPSASASASAAAPKTSDPAGTPADTSAYSKLGSTINVGDSIGTGQSMTSANGNYSLALQNGNLVLTGPSGTKLWESETSDADGGKTVWATFDPDGSLDVKADAYYQAVTKWSTQAGLKNAAQLRINDDGSLVILDSDGDVISTISAADTVKHYYLVQLYRPLGRPPVLEAYLGTTQQWLQDVVDHMGVGKPSQAPDLAKLLSQAGLSDTSDRSDMVNKYTAKIDAIGTIKTKLKGDDVNVDVELGKVAQATIDGLSRIKNLIDTLNDTLRAPATAKGAPADVQQNPIDITIDMQGNLAADKPPTMKAQTVSFLFGAIADCIDSVKSEVGKVNDTAQDSGSGVDKNSPSYKQGYNDGKAAGGDNGGNNGNNNGGNNNGNNNGGNNGANNGLTPGPGTQATPAANTDYSGLYSDLLGNGTTTTGADGTITTTGDGTTGGDVLSDGSSGAPGSNPTSSGTAAAIDAAISKLENSGTASGVNAGTASYGGGSGSGSGTGGSDMSSMMQMMEMMQLMNSGKSTTGSNGTDDGSGDRGRNGAPADTQQGANPQDGQPGQQPAAATPAANPPAVTATPDGGTAPTTGTKSMVDMKLPDGSSQEVSSVVAQAVNAELNNPNGSDARAAYDGTPGAATAGAPWSAVGNSLLPSGESVPDLHTGDVVQWANRTALVVVENGHTMLVMNGTLVQFDPMHPEQLPDDGHGAYGAFQGYFHPSGADLDTTGQQGGTVAPPANATPPPVSAPA